MKHRPTLPQIALAATAFMMVASPSFPQQLASSPEPAAVSTSCLLCHGDADLFDEASLAIVEDYQQDVHAAAGLSCQDCHGGNPAPEVAEELDLAKDESLAANPYRGAPERGAIPAFCGRCHSDPEYMKRFRPGLRIDQEREYWTSYHGKALATGNDRVATCVDCHGIHGILGAENPDSAVYPTRVAETCRTCHSDPEIMAGSQLADGRPLPTEQYTLWRRSFHAAALLDRGDLSAPTCNDCHGNHGAAPPGVESIAFVCGQCHNREAQLFRASRKHAGLQLHNELLADAGPEGCQACHDAPEPQAELTTVHSLAECNICHGNHAVVRATVGILADLPETPCAFCHEGPGALALEVPEPEKTARTYEEMKANLLEVGQADGLEGIDLFNRLVDEALELPTHTFLPEGGNVPELRPEFERLFEKFRIGKTYFEHESSDGGGTVRTLIYRCNRCHAAQETTNGDEPGGLETAHRIREQMQELTTLTARAERIVLAARRGGVETREALTEIDKAVDAQISLEVLVHTFSTAEGGAFSEKQKEGLASARAALEKGQAAMDELAFRRWWLVVILAVLLLVAFGLALKIRELSRHDVQAEGV